MWFEPNYGYVKTFLNFVDLHVIAEQKINK